MMACSTARPLLPRMSLSTTLSLRLASSSTFSMRWTWAAALAHELLARARQRAQLLHRRRRHEAGADQAVGQQVGQPHRVVDVGLAPGHVLDVRGVGQHQLEVAFEHMPHRLPVHAGGLHGDVLDAEASPASRPAPAGPRWWWRRCALPAAARRRRRCARRPRPSACARPVPRSADR